MRSSSNGPIIRRSSLAAGTGPRRPGRSHQLGPGLRPSRLGPLARTLLLWHPRLGRAQSPVVSVCSPAAGRRPRRTASSSSPSVRGPAGSYGSPGASLRSALVRRRLGSRLQPAFIGPLAPAWFTARRSAFRHCHRRRCQDLLFNSLGLRYLQDGASPDRLSVGIEQALTGYRSMLSTHPEKPNTQKRNPRPQRSVVDECRVRSGCVLALLTLATLPPLSPRRDQGHY